jgi:hypothetical protein
MNECIKGLKQLVRKYKTCIDNKLEFRLSDKDLNALKKSIYYLSMIEALVKQWNKEKHEKSVESGSDENA